MSLQLRLSTDKAPHAHCLVKTTALPFGMSRRQARPKHGFTGDNMFVAGPLYWSDHITRASSGFKHTA